MSCYKSFCSYLYFNAFILVKDCFYPSLSAFCHQNCVAVVVVLESMYHAVVMGWKAL